MAFPEDPLGLRIELLLGGVWADITKDVYTRSPITHQRGIRNEGTSADPAAVPITINNKSGRYSNRNPLSPYYGLIGRNTRVRLSLPSEEAYLQLDGDLTSRASTPAHTSLDITGDLDVRWEGETDWHTGGNPRFLIGKWGDAYDRSWSLRLQDGTLRFSAFTTPIESALNVFASVALPALPRRAALRLTMDADNGSGGATLRFYWAESITGPWTQIGDGTAFTTYGPVTLVSSTAPLEIAPAQTVDVDPDRYPLAGRIYKAEVRAGIDGTVVAGPDFTTQAAGTAPFTDGAGRTWTLAGAAAIRDQADRFIGEISEWPQRWVPSGADAWVPVQAAGVLRRLGRGTATLDSALRRRIPAFGPMAYWPMEEGRDATKAYSPVPGIDPLTFTEADWAADTSLPSSGPLPTVGSQAGALSHMIGMVRNYSWASLPAWSVNWMYRMPQVPSARQTFMLIYSSGTVRDWVIQMGPDNSRIFGRDRDGNILTDHTIATSTDIFGEWIMARFVVEQEGSNVRYAMVWSDINGSAGFYENTTPGVTGRPTGVASPLGGFSENIQGMALGHISVWDVYDTAAYDNALNAWSGETSGARMLRLADEESVPLALTGLPEDTEPVGYQQMSPVLDGVKDAAAADGGLLTEDQTQLRLLYRPRSTLYSQTPALVLDYARGEVAAPLEPVDDDTAIRNDVTVQRDQGSAARAVLASGPLSVQDPPDGVGVYNDTVTLSLATDAQAAPKAAWELHLGTWDEPRYPAVTINLHRHPSLIPAVLALREGDMIRLTRMPKWLAPDDVDLMVMGLKEQLLPRTWTITYDCVPAGPWRVGVIGDAESGVVDTDGSVLADTVTADDTTLSVAVTDGPAWITAPPVLNSNPYFADGLAGWTGLGAAIERVPVPAPAPFSGAWAMQVTPDGVAQYPNAGSDQIPVTPGQQYTLSGWLRSATARSVALNLNWFDTIDYLATASNNKAVTAGEWTWFEMTVTAPVDAVGANIAPTVGDFPPSTDVLWAHGLTLRLAGGSPADFPFDIRVGGEVMTVTGISGTSSPQAVTVVRSVNGIRKPQAAGEPVRLAVPATIAL
ncbi:carbohydrate binding domain-containing protein [Streptomyces sp. NPDC044948]|uniref:carbohydrate binding domain-containing protein n=1 Tax=Streptomyces sp. NPDC044948 TaxID=3157092 RepID=UPI0033F2E41E